MSSKFSLLNIVRDHFSNLYDYRTGQRDTFSVFINFVLPFLISSVLIYFRIDLEDNYITLLAVGLNFSLLSIYLVYILNILYRVDRDHDNLKSELVRETTTTVFFTMAISMSIVFITLFTAIGISVIRIDIFASLILSFIVYSLIFIFIFDFMMVIKRLYALLR